MTKWNPADYHIARKKMVETQLVGRGIKDEKVIAAMLSVPRHFFVDEALALQAYSDSPLPIGDGQTISQPYIVAYMAEALKLKTGDRVLEIGSGSGYQTAILATLAAEIYAVERLASIYEKGRQNLARLNFKNIHLKLADGTIGWPEHGPFAAIVVAAGGPKIPKPLIEQLAPDGRLIIPVGTTPHNQKLTLLVKDQDGTITQQQLTDCRFVPLLGQHGF